MKKYLFPLFSVILFSNAVAQRVGINTTTPQTTLDVTAPNDKSHIAGIQAPRLTREELTAKGDDLYGKNQEGTLIYITDVSKGNATGQREVVTEPGYYYFDGSKWQRAVSTAEYTNLYIKDGTLTGNRTVTQGDKTLTFTGTATGGSIFHNTSGKATKPIAALQIIDGAQGEGKILTSDKDGNATWKKASATAIKGTFAENGIESIETPGTYNTGAYITLPHGKWAVSLGMQLEAVAKSPNSIGGYWNVAYLYPAENSTSTISGLPNLPSDKAISNTKFLTAGYIDSQLGIQTLFGSYILTVTEKDPVTFYLFFFPSGNRGGAGGFPSAASYKNIARSDADNTYLYAVKLND